MWIYNPLFWISFPFTSPESTEESPLCGAAGSPVLCVTHRIGDVYVPLTVSQLLMQHQPHSKEALCHGDAPSLPAVLLRLCAQLDLLGCIGPGLYGHPPLCQSLLLGDQDHSLGLRSRVLSAENHPACPVQRQPPRLLSSSSTCSFPLWHMCFPG